jgi:hypothetical protein
MPIEIRMPHLRPIITSLYIVLSAVRCPLSAVRCPLSAVIFTLSLQSLCDRLSAQLVAAALPSSGERQTGVEWLKLEAVADRPLCPLRRDDRDENRGRGFEVGGAEI